MTRSDRRWCWVIAAGLMLVTTLPYALGFLNSDDAWQFSGFVFGVEDGNSYLAKMLTGTYGAWLFRTPYTGTPQAGTVAFLPYLVLGKLVHAPHLHLKLVLLFHMLRLAGIPYLIFSLYRFGAVFLTSSRSRRWVVFLAAAGGGSGWLLPFLGRSTILGSLPLEFYSPETFGFLSILGLPHLILARALLFDALRLYLEAGVDGRKAVRAGLVLSIAILFQPMTVMLGIVVIGVHAAVIAVCALIRNEGHGVGKAVRPALWAVLIPAPLIGFLSLAFLRDPFLSAWTAQNQLVSPHPLHYLLAYGAVIPFALVGGKHLLSRETHAFLPVTWAVMLPVLAYAPVTVQRRLPEGIWICLLILAAAGLERMRSSNRWRMGLVIVCLPSSLLILSGSIQAVQAPGEPLYHPTELVDSFLWARDYLDEGSLVLTSYRTGNILPAYAPLRVVVGHGPESIDLYKLLPAVEEAYAGTADLCGWLAGEGVDVIYVGPYERELGEASFFGVDCLEEIYHQDDIILYSVTHP